MSETAHVRYVFLDIVGFTRKRTVEAQSDLVAALNRIVAAAISVTMEKADETILIPTGDGLAVAILNASSWDIHIRVGLEILRAVAEHNLATADEMRQFQVRIGINENVDNVVLDINKRRNVAGYGISLAQRIMDKADGGQLLVGRATYDILSPREKYNKVFRGYQAVAKHGTHLPVYQLLVDLPGLNVDVPSAFVEEKPRATKLTNFAAYYIAYAATNAAFLLSRNGDHMRDETAIVLLTFLAEDSVDKAGRPAHEAPLTITWHAGKASFAEQYYYYNKLDLWVLSRAADLTSKHELLAYEHLFEGETYDRNLAFVRGAGVQKLRQEYPLIAKEFGLDAASP